MAKKYLISIFVVFIFAFTWLLTIKSEEISARQPKTWKSRFNGIIERVAEGRNVEIKLYHSEEWISVGGYLLKLKEGQKEPQEYFMKGDSLFKKANSDIFSLTRGKISYTYKWLVE